MRVKRGFILSITFSLVFFSFGFAFSQEQPQQVQIAPAAKSEPEIQWVWGEIVSKDDSKAQLIVKYLDYETDQEKELTLSANDLTTYENVKSFQEIKPQDTAGIDYVVDDGGNNIAKNISIENPEGIKTEDSTPDTPDSTKDKAPEDTQPKM
jgi:hypothetical protein